MNAALTIEGLTKVYGNGVTALQGIDLTVREGDFFALLGPNGAGKSTLIGIVCSLVNKTAGRVRIFDADLEHDAYAAKARLGVVPQEMNFNIFEPVYEIVVNQAGYYGIPRRQAAVRAERFLRQLDLWGKRREQARTLSGGMKRRLMIARALVHEPRLLILDEPTAGVDIEIRRSMWQFLREQNAHGTTIILTTHYLEEAESLCRHLAIIDHGRIIEHTSLRGLLARLNTERFVLDLADSADAAPVLSATEVRLLDPHTLEITVDKNQPLNEVFAELTRQGVAVKSLRNQSNRLEQLFVRMLEERRVRS